MNTKMNKYLKYVAAAVFVATLAINIAITLDDPFVLLSDAMAETTDSISTVSVTPNGSYQASMSITYTKGDRYSVDAELETSFWGWVTASVGVGYEKEITQTVTISGIRCCITGASTDFCDPAYPTCFP